MSYWSYRFLTPTLNTYYEIETFEMANCDSCGTSIEAAPSGVLVHVDRYSREKNEVQTQKLCRSCLHKP